MSAAHRQSADKKLHFDGNNVTLSDWSNRPRGGAKGSGTRMWLEATGYGTVPLPNRSARLAAGGLIAMLGDNDVLLLDRAPWAFGDGDALAPMVYPIPRAEGTAWLRLEGSGAPGLLACLCGVDLRPRVFEDLAIAQTFLAGVTAIVIRDDSGGTLGYHILCDITFAAFLAGELVATARRLEELKQ